MSKSCPSKSSRKKKLTVNSPLKWVGGKQSILTNILPYIGSPNTFVEPFIGSATVSLNVKADRYIINDMNYDLINLYNHLLENGQKIEEICIPLFSNMDSDKYYELRSTFNSSKCDSIERAALFLVLNKFGFNGVCRYNNKGEFNVPYSKRPCANFPKQEIEYFIKHFSGSKCELGHGDFTNSLLYDNLKDGDLVYFDPPYLPSDEFDSNFTKYTKEDFSLTQHQQIVDICKSLNEKGVTCLVSNHKTKLTEELYKDADEQIVIPKKRLLAAKKESRMKINEILAVYGKVELSGRLFE